MKNAGLLLNLIVLLFCVGNIAVYSQENSKLITNETAIIAGRNFISANSNGIKSEPQIKDIYTIKTESGTDCIHAINYSDGGFVLVSADRRAVPVLAWSDDGEFDMSNIAPATKLWIDKYIEQFEIIKQSDLNPTEQVELLWKDILRNEVRPLTKGVDKLVLTKWNQDYPYNMQCPEHIAGPGGHVYAGCVATTMAQIINYWEYPSQGRGVVEYFWGDYFDVNLESYTYDFGMMPNTVTFVTSEEQKFQISQLIFHCAIAANMQFGYDGSSSSNTNAWWAFKQNFKYRSGVYEQSKDTTDNDEWKFKLKYDLDMGRPIMYRGTDDGGNGHAFICDGYQDTSYFHFNWGWGGYNDGYYYLDDIDPQMEFHWGQGAIFNLTPNDAPYCNSTAFSFPEWTFNDGSGPNLYFNNTSCNWLIQPDVNDFDFIRLGFKKFSLLPGDTLTIWDGNSENGMLNLRGKYTDNNNPGELTTNGNKFYLEFTTNSDGQAEGWEAYYETVVLGVEDNYAGRISIYPNPAEDIITIDGIVDKTEIAIVDITGKVVCEKSIMGSRIDVSDLSKGLYFIHIINQPENNFKFIKE